MGQYFIVVNPDKEQYLSPHNFGDGLKLMEFGNSQAGTLTGLAVLLADGNGKGLGDLDSDHDIIGSWAGDRVVVAGDYANPGEFVEGDDNLFTVAGDEYENISDEVIRAIVDGEGERHPLSSIDLTADGWRSRSGFGES